MYRRSTTWYIDDWYCYSKYGRPSDRRRPGLPSTTCIRFSQIVLRRSSPVARDVNSLTIRSCSALMSTRRRTNSFFCYNTCIQTTSEENTRTRGFCVEVKVEMVCLKRHTRDCVHQSRATATWKTDTHNSSMTGGGCVYRIGAGTVQEPEWCATIQ